MQGIQESSRYPIGGASLKALLDAYERQLIETALAATAGNQRRAARTLGLLPTTLHEKMKRLGLLKRRNGAAELEEEARAS
jgi:DNA-binding NtrC family response regulator